MSGAPVPPLALRRAGPIDVAVVHALLAAAGEALRARGFGNWTPPYPAERIAVDVVTRDVWLAETGDGEPVATFMLGAEPHRAYAAMAWARPDAPARYVNRVAVHPAHEGRGIGGWCLAEAARLAREGGAAALRCDVLRENARLCRFYERNGFVARGTREHSGWTFTCYERELS
jgi:ribosomal protein S18 acetylase RimI-like enzyme